MSMIYGTTVCSGDQGLLVWEEFIASTGIDPDRLRELLSLGWLEADRGRGEEILFRDVDIYRVRKLERICCDFDLPVLGGTIIVDLLERVDQLERKVKALHDMED